MTRCINIDWLEIYAHELEDGTTRDADFFRQHGIYVQERDYGTRQYSQMFILHDEWAEPFIEIRREPKGLSSLTGFSVLDKGSCHIRLSNRTCYCKNPAQILIDFCDRFGYIISRISRLDICLDFEKFDSGDDPNKFVQRYVSGKYSKINQSNLRAFGKDMWDGRFWNSLSWGSHTSQISTKIYNKTMELAERRDKPYIRQAWAAAGLIDDFIEMTKQRKDGTTYKPSIWRLEFSIKSSVKKWFVIEDHSEGHKKIRSIHHTLEDYTSKKLLIEHFAGLCRHYFYFKHFVKDQRKDRCKDKILFRFSDVQTFYEVEHTATAKPNIDALVRLKSRLREYRQRHQFGSEAQAIDAVLEMIHQDEIKGISSSHACTSELMAMRYYIARRIKGEQVGSIADELAFVESIMTLPDRIF